MNGERIAEVLAAHHVAVVSSTGDGTALVMCSCTHESEVSGSAELDYGDYAVVNAAHQAAILAPLFAAAQAEAFDVIFMDVRMPELDGRETTRRLRATSGANQHVPVIAVTADTSEEDVAACAAAGMTWFVAKPLTPATLLGALEAVLNGQAALDTPETQAA